MTREPLDDPDYVQWTVLFQNDTTGDMPTDSIVKFHKCTDEEYESFYPPTRLYEKNIEALKAQRQMYCLDPAEDQDLPLEVYGSNDLT